MMNIFDKNAYLVKPKELKFTPMLGHVGQEYQGNI